MNSLTVATWNLKWCSAESERVDRVRERIEELGADILVLTETSIDLAPAGGFVVEGGTDWGYPASAWRRKVLLWSRWPVSATGNDLIDPPGRHACATVEAPSGPVRVHAVCIPWEQAHVTTGRRDRGGWDEHVQFIESLAELLKREARNPELSKLPLIVSGDMNQREILRPGTARVRQAWRDLKDERKLVLASSPRVIDQVVIGKGLSPVSANVFKADGLSDHHAVNSVLETS